MVMALMTLLLEQQLSPPNFPLPPPYYGLRLQTGQSYVVFGRRSGWPKALELSALNGVNGFALNGIHNNDHSGSSVASAGDINGDSLSDIIIGAPDAGEYYVSPDGMAESNVGQSYVVFGNRNTWPAAFELSTLTGFNGLTLNRTFSEYKVKYGQNDAPVAGAGDVNGDGFEDIIIGALSANPVGRLNAGQIYVVFLNKDLLSLPTSTASPLTTTADISSNSSLTTKGSSFTIGALVGIIAGSLVGTSVLALVAFMLWKRYQSPAMPATLTSGDFQHG